MITVFKFLEKYESTFSINRDQCTFLSLQVIDKVKHYHDYIETKRDGRVVVAFDQLQASCSEFCDFMHEFQQAKLSAELLNSMVVKGQLLSLTAVKDSDANFCYYTGLPSFNVFQALYHYLEPLAIDMQYVSCSSKSHNSLRFRNKPGRPRALSMEEEFFVTLIRLRLGLPSKDLARRFGIAESTLSVVFNTWVSLLSTELEQICCMPSVNRNNLKQADCFQTFDNVRIVLDCTEVFSQTPGSLSAHRHMHSNCKHHCTVKCLVVMSPSAAIIYISSMWDGRASDKKITSASE